jgi:hypothetical protein
VGQDRRGLPELADLPQSTSLLHFTCAAQHVDLDVANLKQLGIKPNGKARAICGALLPPGFGQEASPPELIQQGFANDH